MSDTERPPSYEELFPHRDLPSHLAPAALLERFSAAAPHHATYFEVEKDWREGGGYYRGNQSLLAVTCRSFSHSSCHSISFSRWAGLEGEEGGGGQHGVAGGGDGLLWRLAQGHHGGSGKYVVGRHWQCLLWPLGKGSDARQVRYLHFTSLSSPLLSLSLSTLFSGEIQFGPGSVKAGQTVSGHFR